MEKPFPVDQPGVVLWNLAAPDARARVSAVGRLYTRGRTLEPNATNYVDRLGSVLLEEWRAVGTRSPLLVAPLVQALCQDPALHTMEVIALALALQGEDGVTELVELLDTSDFAVRAKAANAIGALRKSARWAVPKLLRALQAESNGIVTFSLLNALGRIGGKEALAALEAMYSAQCESAAPDQHVIDALEDALALARVKE